MLARIKNDVINVYKHDKERLNHIYGVRETALKLGKIHHVNLHDIELASYLHDITKSEPLTYHKTMILTHYDSKILADFSDPLYHAYSAAALAKDKYGITNKDIIGAIESHTVGKPNMTPLEKILFISDYIEPNRLYPSCVIVREIAFKDLDQAIFETIDLSIKFYKKIGGKIPKIAQEAHDYYKPLGGKTWKK